MTFSYNLVLALFLLAPGFSAFAGLFFSSHKEKRVHPAPPSPTSVLTLALVSLAALALHAIWAVVLFGQDLWVGAGLPHFIVPFEPNIYADLLNAGHDDEEARLAGGEIAAILLTLAGLSLAGYFTTTAVILSAWGNALTRPFLYGWAANLVEQINGETEPGYVRLVTAFVLTTIEGDGAVFGYEGLLQNLTLTPEKSITSVTLSQVTAFYVKPAPGHFKRIVLPRTKGIPDLFLPKEQIRNVSFTVFRVPEEEELRGDVVAASSATPRPTEIRRRIHRLRQGQTLKSGRAEHPKD